MIGSDVLYGFCRFDVDDRIGYRMAVLPTNGVVMFQCAHGPPRSVVLIVMDPVSDI